MNSFQQEEMLYLAALMDIDSQVAFAGIHESSQLLLLGNKCNQGSSKLILFGNDCNQGWMHGWAPDLWGGMFLQAPRSRFLSHPIFLPSSHPPANPYILLIV